ncbi:protein far1-related sequence 5-like [Gigaspora margarita]|uniref:Protein far1-related sequence 5-like n=1 Tax=Gigaspora margarita TaxID=4874 RepID=A0A8H3XGC7_GIGMA|nr:protein far1-related sequence 5-like [Gigaspora margarita]
MGQMLYLLAEYQDYLKNLSFTIGSSSEIYIFSDIIELIKSSLTDEIFRIQKAQIDICFEYFSIWIPSNQYKTCDEVDNSDISNCLEDSTNKYQIALNSVINRVGLINIWEIWEAKNIAANTISFNYVALLKDNSHICTCLLLISDGLQIYGEYAALGCKLASLAAEFHLTHIATTLQGLIQQIENTSLNNTSQDQDIICNLLQASTKGKMS